MDSMQINILLRKINKFLPLIKFKSVQSNLAQSTPRQRHQSIPAGIFPRGEGTRFILGVSNENQNFV